MPSMPSYLLENLVLNYFEEKGKASKFVSKEIIYVLQYIKDNIWWEINDPKGIQGNLNTLTMSDKIKIAQKAESDFKTALAAAEFDSTNNHKEALKEWRKIFGNDFPQYG